MAFFLKTDLRGKPPRPMLRGRVYYIRKRQFGKDVWRSLHTTDKKEAEYLALAIWREWQTETVKEIIPPPPRPLPLVWDKYAKSEYFTLLSELTRHTKRQQWEAFQKWCDGRRIRYPHQLTPEACIEYLTRNGQKNKTFNNILGDLKLIFAYGGAECNPFDNIRRRSTKRAESDKISDSFNLLTDSQIEQILLHLKFSRIRNREEWHDAALLASRTGLRYKDVALLRFDSVHYDNKGAYLEVSPAKTTAKTGGKVVYIRLIPLVSDLLEKRRMTTIGEYVFPNQRESYQKIGKNGLPNAFRATAPFSRLCERLGINATFHSFRVAVITKAARAGIDLEEFGGVVGHTSKEQTMAYNRAALEIDMNRIFEIEL